MDVTPAQLLFDELRRITRFTFSAQSDHSDGWNAQGSGSVTTEFADTDILHFRESGSWQTSQGTEIGVRNVYRWTQLAADRVRLEHLRFGAQHPVLLFDMEPSADRKEWRSVAPHLCREDCYSARLASIATGLQLDWSVVGPKKNEKVRYEYSQTS